MTSIIDAACARLTLGREGSPPFHLIARIHSEGSADKMDGTYELLWANRGRFREIFRFGAISETNVAVEPKRYILRNTPLTSYQQREFARLLNLPLAVAPVTSRKVTKVYEETRGSSSMLCADLEDTYQNRKVCVDPTTHEIVLDAFDSDSADGKFTFEASNFTTIGTARFPLHVVRAAPHESLEVNVDKLMQASSFGDGVFTAPSGASEHDWCVDPVTHDRPLVAPQGVIDQIRLRAHNEDKGRTPRAWAYLLAIDPDGRLQQSLPVYGDAPEIDSEMESYFKEQRFATRTCGGRAIGYETMFELSLNGKRAPFYLF